MSGAIKKLAIDASRADQRVDNFLFTNLKGVPKSLIYRYLRTGKIRVNGKKIKQTYRLQVDDELLIPEIRSSSPKKVVIPDAAIKKIQSSIVFEDELFLVLNKPSGIAVHPGTQIRYGIIEIVRAFKPDASFLELAHRLDRDTSGCLVIAKQKSALDEIHSLFRNNEVEKEYILLVKGQWKYDSKTINSPVGNKRFKKDKSVQHQDRHASTSFSPIQIFKEFSLLSATIHTGRTHQIRIHAAELNHPIIGDKKYGDFSMNRSCSRRGLKRLFLHATKLKFEFKSCSNPYEFTSQMADELSSFISGL